MRLANGPSSEGVLYHGGAGPSHMKSSLRAQAPSYSSVVKVVEQCGEELSAQGVVNAPYGLRSMGDSDEVRQVLAALTVKVEQCGEELKPQEVAMAPTGIKRLCDSEEVRQLLAALTVKVRQCEGLDERAVGTVMNGLRRLGDSQEVQELSWLALLALLDEDGQP